MGLNSTNTLITTHQMGTRSVCKSNKEQTRNEMQPFKAACRKCCWLESHQHVGNFLFMAKPGSLLSFPLFESRLSFQIQTFTDEKSKDFDIYLQRLFQKLLLELLEIWLAVGKANVFSNE